MIPGLRETREVGPTSGPANCLPEEFQDHTEKGQYHRVGVQGDHGGYTSQGKTLECRVLPREEAYKICRGMHWSGSIDLHMHARLVTAGKRAFQNCSPHFLTARGAPELCSLTSQPDETAAVPELWPASPPVDLGEP